MVAKPRILVLCHSPFVGGAELALASLIHSTRDSYEWVAVFAGETQPDSSLVRDLHNYAVLDLPWWCYEAHDKPKKVRRKTLLHSIAQLKSLAKEADVLLTNTMTIPWLGAVAAEIGKPHIWYVHEFGDIDHNLQFIPGYDESLRIIDKLSTRVLTIGDSVKSHITRRITMGKVDIIHQAIELETLTALPKPNYTRPLKLVCMGAIKHSKGQLVAAKAVNSLPEDYSVTLSIQGPNADSAYLELLQKQASPRVRIIPERYDVKDILSSHDVLLMCSENEALGRVTLEGLAAGRAVVGYACPSTKELLADNRGLLYSKNSPESLGSVLQNDLDAFIRGYSSDKNKAFVSSLYCEERQASDFKKTVLAIRDYKALDFKFLDDYLALMESRSLFMRPSQTIVGRIAPFVPEAIKQLLKEMIRK